MRHIKIPCSGDYEVILCPVLNAATPETPENYLNFQEVVVNSNGTIVNGVKDEEIFDLIIGIFNDFFVEIGEYFMVVDAIRLTVFIFSYVDVIKRVY